MFRRTLIGFAVVLLALAAAFRCKQPRNPDDDNLMHFLPPSDTERLAAIGDLSQLDTMLRRVFEPSEDFAPIPPPGPNDWLTHHPEGGQTYDAFLREQPNRPNHERSIIYLQPIGEFLGSDAARLEPLRGFTETYFCLETKLLPNVMFDDSVIASRVNSRANRMQLNSSDIIQWLTPRLPPDAYCLLGVILTDLYYGDFNYVFGQATTHGRVGVYSFARFDPAFFNDPVSADVDTLILRRSCRTLAHETCHMFGMPHCIHFACIVNGHKNLAESDAAPLHPCPVCLRKLHTSVGFDPIERERQLLAFYQRHGLTNEADWTRKRLQKLERTLTQ